MPHRVPLHPGDPDRVGGYLLGGRLAGIPSDDPICLGTAPGGALVSVSLLSGDWDAAALDRFADEAEGARRVPPFCAARVLDAGLDGNFAYLVSEYIEGPSLLELVAAGGVLAGPQLEALAIGTAAGLASVHQAALVHGNFGPQFVILPPAGPPCVVEYGITPPYGAATPSADMLGWARTVVFAATGQQPGQAVNLSALPAHVREPVRQCLEYEASERPAGRAVVQYMLGGRSQHAGLLAEASRRCAQDDWSPRPEPDLAPVPARSSGSFPRPHASPARGTPMLPPARSGPGHSSPGRRSPGRPRRRRGRWVAAAATAVLVVIAVVTANLLASRSGGSHARPSLAAGNQTATASPAPSAASGPAVTLPPTATAPRDFGGVWGGQVSTLPGVANVSGTSTFAVTVTLKSGSPTGSIIYTYDTGSGTERCGGSLDVETASHSQMTMTIATDKSACSNGVQVTVTMQASGQAIRFALAGPSAASGLLTPMS